MVSATGLVGRFLLGAVPLNSLELPYVKRTARYCRTLGTMVRISDGVGWGGFSYLKVSIQRSSDGARCLWVTAAQVASPFVWDESLRSGATSRLPELAEAAAAEGCWAGKSVERAASSRRCFFLFWPHGF